MATSSRRRRPRRAGLRADQPVRGHARGRRVGRRLARAAARPRGLARLRARSASPLAFADRLWEALGPFLLVAAAGLVVACVRRCRADLVLASFVLAYALYLLPLDAHFDRYVLPLVPVLGVLAGGSGRCVRSPLSCSSFRSSGRSATHASSPAPTPARLPRLDRGARRSGPAPRRRPVDAAAPAARLLRLELPGPGRPTDPNRDLAGSRRRCPLGVRLGRRHRPGARRPRRLPRRGGFYDALARRAPAFELLPDGHVAGPWVRVYRL